MWYRSMALATDLSVHQPSELETTLCKLRALYPILLYALQPIAAFPPQYRRESDYTRLSPPPLVSGMLFLLIKSLLNTTFLGLLNF